MTAFIKITDIGNKEHYLNTNYIIKFKPLGKNNVGNALIYLDNNDKVETSTTCEEILDMIELAKS